MDMDDDESPTTTPHNPTQTYPTINSIHKYTITYVIKRGYFNLIRYMLKLGVDPNYVNEKEDLMRTGLILCTFIKDEQWSLNVAHNLLEHGALLNKTDSRYLNAIHYCCAFGREKLLEVYLNSLDFDLSKALDLNGNSCMHYAIYSHNFNIVNMLIKRYRHFNMTRVNLRNVFGLRPSDIEDEKEDEISKLSTGNNKIIECKRVLANLVKYFDDLRELELARKRAQEELERRMAEAAAESIKTKNKKGKRSRKSSASSTTSINSTSSKKPIAKSKKIPPKKTEIETIHEVKELDLSSQSILINESPKSSPKVNRRKKSPGAKSGLSSSSSNKKKFFSTELDESPNNSQLFQNIKPLHDKDKASKKSFKSNSNSRELLSNLIISKEQAQDLTSKSLIITYKDCLNNLIEYNSLFYAREYMLESAFTNKDSRLSRRSTVQKNDQEEKLKIIRPITSHSLINKNRIDKKNEDKKPPVNPPDWKKELPTMFKKLELLITPSYRETVYPPLNKKVIKNPKKELMEQKQELKRALARLKKFEKEKDHHQNIRKFSSASQSQLRSSSVISYANSTISFDGSQFGDIFETSIANQASFLDTLSNKNNKNKILI
jgi:hypothetical protein